MDNGRHLISINSDYQSCVTPFDIVLNDLEYENMYDPLREQSHQPYNATHTTRINISTRATIVPFSSGLSDEELNT